VSEEEIRRGDQEKRGGRPRSRCPGCGCLRYDVKVRPDHFARDVWNDPTVTMTCCAACEQENAEDI
jgi:hypothetical protein